MINAAGTDALKGQQEKAVEMNEAYVGEGECEEVRGKAIWRPKEAETEVDDFWGWRWWR